MERRNRQEQKSQTRAALLAAGRAAFAELGYGAATVADLAARAGVASGTFYVHFPSKEALADALLADFNAEMAERIAPILSRGPGASLEEIVAGVADAYFAHLSDHRDIVTTYAQRSAAGLGVEEFREGINPPMLGLLRRVLERAPVAKSRFDLDLATHGLLAMWLRIGLQVLHRQRLARKKAKDTLWP
jgi:AcrR family transcriptional regulator